MEKHNPTIPALRAEAAALLAGNRLDEAQSACERLLELAPDDIEGQLLLCAIMRHSGRPEAAESCARRVLALQPANPAASLELGATLQLRGQPDAAADCYRTAARNAPRNAEAHYLLANALRESGRLDEAVASYHNALQLEPDHFASLNNLGMLLANLGNNRAAVDCLLQALRLQPDNPVTLTNLGDACVSLGRFEDACRHLREAVRISPDFPAAQRALANALHHTGALQDALAAYGRLAELQPGSADAALGQARIHEQLGNYRESYRLLEPLLEAGNPAAVPTFFDISRHLGRRDEAVHMLEELLEHGTLRSDSVAAIRFKLGRHYDESGDYDRAFAHYREANALMPASFDRRGLQRFVDDSRMVYSESFVRSMPTARNRSRLPVFIVGMPRSGTSLVEQILAAHPGVHGAGELQDISRIVQRLAAGYPAVPLPLFLRNLTRGELDGAANEHLRKLQALGKNASRVTDKMPGNIRYVGLILQLFPRAAIIHTTRHPLDTCLSCFFANFGTTGHDYIYDLKTVGEYYLEYHRLMQHWESVFPQQILRIPYEQLVSDQETITRRLLEFCGLTWDERCLSFHETDRTVFTLSYDQVRQPLYTRALGRREHYAQYLEPLRAQLEAGGINCS